MKTAFVFIFSFLSFAGTACAQSMTILPGVLDLPRTATLPGCTAATKGRIFYNTTDNRMYYCNGASWINTEVSGPQSEPAFSVTNTGDVYYTQMDYQPGNTIVPFNNERYDTGSNFYLNNMSNSNSFVAPANGIYHFDASASMSFGGVTILNTSYVGIHLIVTNVSNGFVTVAATRILAPVSNDSFSVHISRDLKLAAGDKVRVSVSDGVGGSSHFLKSDLSSFNGHLVTKY